MRILVASHRFPPDNLGGVERLVEMLAAELSANGDTVGIAVRRWSSAAPFSTPRIVREQLPGGVPLVRFAGGDVRLDRFLDHHERLEQLFSDVLREFQPDVVHVYHLLGLSPRFVEMAHRHGAAVVVSLQDFYVACPLVHLRKPSGELCPGPDGGLNCARTCFAHEGDQAELRWGLRASYFRRILATAERVICPSEYVATYFAEYGVAPARMRLIPNGITIDARDPQPAPGTDLREPAGLRLAFMGAMVPHKGPHVILEALRLARLPAVSLTLLGQTPDEDYARTLEAAATAIPGLVTQLHGPYDPSELPGLLHHIDCLIVPSQVPETFAIVTREALALGIPILVSRLGALPEAVREGENGHTFAHDRPEELAVLLTQLAGDPALLARLRSGARRTRVVTAGEHVRAVRAVYVEAIEEFARGGATRRGDQEEIAFLHRALLGAGFEADRGGAPAASPVGVATAEDNSGGATPAPAERSGSPALAETGRRVPHTALAGEHRVMKGQEPTMATTALPQAAPENHPDYPTYKYVVPIPSPDLMRNIGSHDLLSFLLIGEAWAQVITTFLRSNATLLDIGSGCGRIARFLINLPEIQYIGFDISQANVEWCAANLTPRSRGRFQFHHFDGRSDYYNPTGTISVSEYRFPASDATVDLAFAASVFTHLKREDALHYLRETHRVLKPGGLALFSILTESQGRPFLGTEERVDIDPSYFVRMASRSGLALRERIGDLYGQELFLLENLAEPDESESILRRLARCLTRRGGGAAVAEQGQARGMGELPARPPASGDARQLPTGDPYQPPAPPERAPQVPSGEAGDIARSVAPAAATATPETTTGATPLPPEPLRTRVHGSPEAESFVAVGQCCADDIEAALASIGRDATSFSAILDFGCGCGRTLIHLAPRWPHARFWGTDIDAEAIAWCRQELPLATFGVNDALPPLPFASDSFDLIYAISVFTHLNDDFQFRWLAELQRVARPGGVVLLSLHGTYFTDEPSRMPAGVSAKLEAAGFAFIELASPNSPFPDWYQAAFHTPEYVRATFAEYFEVRDYIPKGLNQHQDLVILAKR